MSVKNLLPLLPLCVLFACSKPDVAPDQGDDQLAKEVKAIDATLLSNTKDYIMYQPTGIRLAVHSFGNGPKPLQSQSVLFSSTSRLFPSQVLVDSLPYNGFAYNITPSGLKSAIQLLPVGSKATIFIPSPYGYGPNGSGKIPSNTTVTYEVEIVKATRSAAEQTQWSIDTLAIHKYLKDNNLTAQYDSSGIWYSLDTLGSGDYATPANKITCDYTGTTLKSNIPFDARTLDAYPLLNVVDGFRIGVCKMKVGNNATIYIPSGLGYGTTGNGNGTIPANTVLIFKVKLRGLAK